MDRAQNIVKNEIQDIPKIALITLAGIGALLIGHWTGAVSIESLIPKFPGS